MFTPYTFGGCKYTDNILIINIIINNLHLCSLSRGLRD